MAFSLGHISGCHLNPAVSVSLAVGGRFTKSELIPYIVAQVLGGIARATILYAIASGADGFKSKAGFAPLAIGLCLTLIYCNYSGGSEIC